MNTSSTPFIRNDYWPDYNDINQLNQRIDDVENEISLVNIRLSTDIENVSNNLNTYAKEQADTSISNNIIVNNLNANYAEGRFANFDNTFTNNAYVENLTVNKPVFDITLNTPHLENTTSLGGNFYNANLFDANISNLYVNISSAPVQSSTVLGYDSEGRVIPVHATYDVGFPENADYLWTDQTGAAFRGVAATEIGEVENLITAYGVKNAIDALNTEVVDNFNLVNDNLNNIHQWQSSFENSVANNFNDVNNTLNDVANSLNGMNAATETLQSSVNENFNTLNNQLNNVESSIKTINDFMFNDIYIPEYGSFNSTSPVNYTGAKTVELYGNAQGGTAIPGGGGRIKFDTTNKIVTFGFSGACKSIRNANSMFFNCRILNQNILIPNSVKDASYMFFDCRNLNQNILIPNSVKDANYMFSACYPLNQNILIPNSVENARRMFYLCNHLNQNILIPNSVENATEMFFGCISLNQDIYSYFQNVNMNTGTTGGTSIDNMFFGTKVNLHNVHIPSSVPKDTSNNLYNCLVNGKTGLVFAPENIINDLPVDPVVWPPVD